MAIPTPSYAPLETEEASESPVEPTPPTAVATSEREITKATMVVSVPLSDSPVTTISDRCTVTSCCCGCSLPTGIRIMAGLEIFYASWLCCLVIASIYLKIFEKQIDHAIEHNMVRTGCYGSSQQSLSNCVCHESCASCGFYHNPVGADDCITCADGSSVQPAFSDGTGFCNGGLDTDGTATVSNDDFDLDATIKSINMAIDVNATMTPIWAVLMVLSLYFACKGFKAARGDLDAARSYYKWKTALVFLALVYGMVTPNLLCMLFNVGLAFYFACVTKSHYINLLNESQSPLPTTAPATLVITGQAVEAV